MMRLCTTGCGLLSALTILLGFMASQNCVAAAIRCSKCDSLKDKHKEDCERRPPAPTPCPENQAKTYCSIVRETRADGSTIRFARDCSTSKVDEKCVARNSTPTIQHVCYRTCDTDGCNSKRFSLNGTPARSAPLIALSLLCAVAVHVTS